MSNKHIRIDVTEEQVVRLRQKVLSNLQLSGEQRRAAAKNVLLLPQDGSPVDLYCGGKFVGAL